MAKRVILHPHALSPENPTVLQAVIEFVDLAFPGNTDCHIEWMFANANGYVAKVSQGSFQRVLKLGRSSYNPDQRVPAPKGLAHSLSSRVMSSYKHSYSEFPDEYIAMEFTLLPYYPGKNYRGALDIESSSLTLEQRLRMGLEAIFAVQQLHTAGIVHLDLKPENIVWDTDHREAVLIDFDTSQHLSHMDTIQLKPNDAMRGTPPYLAPESQEHRKYNYASDVYAMSVILCADLGLVPAELERSNQATTSRRSSSLPAQWVLKTTPGNQLPKLSSAQQVLWRGLSYNSTERPGLDSLADALVSIAKEKLNPQQVRAIQVRLNEMRSLQALLDVHSRELIHDGGKTRLHLPLDLCFAAKCQALAKHAFSSTNRLFKISLLPNRTLRVMQQVGWLEGVSVTDFAPQAFQQAWRNLASQGAKSFGAHPARAGVDDKRLARPLDYS